MTQEAARLTDRQPSLADEREMIVASLRATPKRLSPKYFYDRRGSELFDRICELPEYYPTRTELAIMRDNAASIGAAVGPGACVIEFGSGSSTKIRLLLDMLDDVRAYVPVEISGEYLQAVAASLSADFPRLHVVPVCADFTRPFELPDEVRGAHNRLAFFPGSTIGNFERQQSVALLRVMRETVGPGGGLLIGVDLQKDRKVLERAYNDAAGVTAEFNLNPLRSLNRELGANFELSRFTHRADYDADDGRIVMQLFSRGEQTVRVGGDAVRFADGERIITEYSHKHTLAGFAAMATEAGFSVRDVGTDAADWFSVQHLRAEA
jgi:dimethylhistidine N-methyltransferase